jgi:hypothetical protein
MRSRAQGENKKRRERSCTGEDSTSTGAAGIEVLASVACPLTLLLIVGRMIEDPFGEMTTLLLLDVPPLELRAA